MLIYVPYTYRRFPFLRILSGGSYDGIIKRLFMREQEVTDKIRLTAKHNEWGGNPKSRFFDFNGRTASTTRPYTTRHHTTTNSI